MGEASRRGERPRLLIVGGNGSTPSRFARAWPHLEERFRPTVVEVAGQGGRAGVTMPDSFAGFVEDLAAGLVRAAAGEKTVCFGHGIGGLLLAHAVRGTPEVASRLILHAPVGALISRRRLPFLLVRRPRGAVVRSLLG